MSTPTVNAITLRTGEILAAVEERPGGIVLHVPPSPRLTEYATTNTYELELQPSEARQLARELNRAAGPEPERRFALLDDGCVPLTAEDVRNAMEKVYGRKLEPLHGVTRGEW